VSNCGGGEARQKEVSTFGELTYDDIAELKRTLVRGDIPTNRTIIIGRKKFNKRYADDDSELKNDSIEI